MAPNRFLAPFLSVLLLASLGSAQTGKEGKDYFAGELLLQIAPKTLSKLDAVAGAVGAKRTDSIARWDLHRVRLPKGWSVAKGVAYFRAYPWALEVDANYIHRLFDAPTDPRYPEQWDMRRINAEQAWEEFPVDPNVTVAVLDSGVDTSHPDLAGVVVEELSFTDRPAAGDEHPLLHGTFVSTRIAGRRNDRVGMAGVAPGASILSMKVANANGEVDGFAVLDAWSACLDRGVDIVNMSFGAPVPDPFSAVAVLDMTAQDMVLIAGAGNTGLSWPMWPAAYGGVMAVTGCDGDDRQDPDAAFGMWTDIAAPSVGVPVFHPDGFVAFLGGTSHAAPLVTGAAALVLSRLRESLGTNAIPYVQVHGFLTSHCDPVVGSGWVANGRLNVLRSLRALPATPHVATHVPTSQDPVDVQAGQQLGGGTSSTQVVLDGDVLNVRVPSSTAPALVEATVPIEHPGTLEALDLTLWHWPQGSLAIVHVDAFHEAQGVWFRQGTLVGSPWVLQPDNVVFNRVAEDYLDAEGRVRIRLQARPVPYFGASMTWGIDAIHLRATASTPALDD